MEQSGELGANDASGEESAPVCSASATPNGPCTAEQDHLAQDVLQGSYGPVPNVVLDIMTEMRSDSVGRADQPS